MAEGKEFSKLTRLMKSKNL